MTAGLIQKKAKTPIIISQSIGSYTEGKPAFADVNALALLFDMAQCDRLLWHYQERT